MNNFICKIATLEEMNEKWDYEIDNATQDKENWVVEVTKPIKLVK